ncbi:MAG: transglutaminase-like domain-containing protein, partial [Bacteroidales bacterium]|nr:transglutaminase-like domain-containing protein [Bacteroidales bacterium]
MNFRDRCGVCKDKAGMLVTMLRAAGFESYAAMTMAGSRIEDIPADQFNHSITVVKLSDGSYKLLDPTWVPFVRELWSSAEQQQNYLLGLPEGADLMKTPVSSPENHYFNLNLQTELLSNGDLSGKLIVDAEGQSDAAIRRAFTSRPVNTWEPHLRRQLKQLNPKAQIKSMNYGDPYDYSDPIKITMTFVIPEYAVKIDGKLYINPLGTQNLFSSANYHRYFNTNIKSRKYAFRDRCSRLVQIQETLKLPDNAVIVSKTENMQGHSQAADYNLSYNTKHQALILTQKLSFKKRVYNANDWPGYREAVKAQKEYEKEPVIINLK